MAFDLSIDRCKRKRSDDRRRGSGSDHLHVTQYYSRMSYRKWYYDKHPFLIAQKLKSWLCTLQMRASLWWNEKD